MKELFIFSLIIFPCMFISAPLHSQGSAGMWGVPFTARALQNGLWIGSDQGLFLQNPATRRFEKVWQDSVVKKILPVPYGLFILTEKGIFFSMDGKTWNARNDGLITKTIKEFRNSTVSFSTEIQDLKDLEADPVNPDNLVSCTKDGLYLSTNQGLKWQFFPTPSSASGIKSVSVLSMPDLTVFIGHPFNGVYVKNITRNSAWARQQEGLYQYSDFVEEISDLNAFLSADGPKLLCANNFFPHLYLYQGARRSWQKIFRREGDFGMMESLFTRQGSLFFVTENGLREYRLEQTNKQPEIRNNLTNTDFSLSRPELISPLLELFRTETGARAESLCYMKNGSPEWVLSELWLLQKEKHKPTTLTADGRKGLYMPTGTARSPRDLEKTLKVMETAGLNMITIDMKDDWGYLRFRPQSELLKKAGRVVGPVDVESFVKKMKEKNIYLVARLVSFKDKVLYEYDGGRYAIRDAKTKLPWRGVMKGSDGKPQITEEYWVDPYSEFVWQYMVTVASELTARGFDEVQFDYIRFPTDADNLGNCYYSHRSPGMDKESALISFLRYARENMSAPISVDIYGANGWYRTAARTGQDVELLAHYVDAICPMYYPSHFYNNFLYYPPYDQRTYRIYYYGSFRNYYMARKNTVVRPYAQAFNLYTSYDRAYYGTGYIRNQVAGVNDSINMGYTFWNAGNDYRILSQTYTAQATNGSKAQ